MHLIRDQKGTAAVEFAFIAPLMILLYFGLAELVLGIMAKQRVDHAASVVGDLVAQSPQLTTNDLADIFAVGSSILSPYSAATLSMRVKDVEVGADNQVRVIWSRPYGSGYSVQRAGEVVALPAALNAKAGDNVIVSEVKYTYVSPFGKVMPKDVTFQQTYHLRPRNAGMKVTCSNC